MDQAATGMMLTIVSLLAECAVDERLNLAKRAILNHNVEALIAHDSDEFVRKFLAATSKATGVLTARVGRKLSRYP